MSSWSSLKGFFRALRSKERSNAILRAPDSLAKTVVESTHVGGGAAGGPSRAGTGDQHEIVAEGHDDYQESFDKDG